MSNSVVIAESGTLSSAIHSNSKKYIIGLEIPALTLCSLYIQASEDGITYRRVLRSDGSGDWVIPNTEGNRFIFIDQAAPFKYHKLESSVVQTSERTFNFVFKDEY